jgi:hypothetical protein
VGWTGYVTGGGDDDDNDVVLLDDCVGASFECVGIPEVTTTSDGVVSDVLLFKTMASDCSDVPLPSTLDSSVFCILAAAAIILPESSLFRFCLYLPTKKKNTSSAERATPPTLPMTTPITKLFGPLSSSLSIVTIGVTDMMEFIATGASLITGAVVGDFVTTSIVGFMVGI